MAIGIVKMDPVVHCGGLGAAAPDEYEAFSASGANYYLTPGIPPGSRIVDVWYQPEHNVGALSAFSLLAVNRKNDTQFVLTAQSYPGQANRLRLLICVLWES